MSMKIRLIIFVGAITLGQAFAVVSGTEAFPFSPYGMYSKKFDGNFRLIIVSGTDFQNSKINIPAKTVFWPLWNAALNESILRNISHHPDNINKITHDLLDLYLRRHEKANLPAISKLSLQMLTYKGTSGDTVNFEKISERLLAEAQFQTKN